jgi:glycosyltransferase involved in cell wall biosynthesis
VWSVCTWILKKKYDIVYIRLVQPSELVAGLVAKIILKKKLVILISDLHTKFVEGQGKIIRPIFKVALNRGDLIISYSPRILLEIESYYGKINPTKIAIIKSAVDTSRFKPSISNKDNTILCVSRITSVKGIENIINSMPHVIKFIPEVRLMVVGPIISKSYLHDLERLVSRLGLKKSIDFIGPIQHNRIIKYYNSSKIILLMSKSEALPKSIIEAMSCGKPVIVSSVGGLPDLIEDGVNGIILDTNDPIILAEKIIGLLSNESFRDAMGNAARKTIEEYHTWDLFIEQLTNHFIRI